MAAKDKLKNVGQSIIGSAKKAVLIFPPIPPASRDTESTAENIVQMTSDKLNSVNGGGDIASGLAGPRYLEVQYNPASIRYSATARPVRIPSLQNSLEPNAQNPQIIRPASVSMQVDLIFNDVNVKDAFMADKLRVSANDIVTDVATGVNKKFNGGYSVQAQSNGLVAATFLEYNRSVTFHWADTDFSGEIESVSVKYTMFSVSGRPIHSVVTLRIIQTLETEAAKKYWNEQKFDKCFNKKQNRSIGQAVGNLFNI